MVDIINAKFILVGTDPTSYVSVKLKNFKVNTVSYHKFCFSFDTIIVHVVI